MLNRRKRQIAFTCEQSQIIDLNDGKGIFTIREIKIFSLHNPEITVVIKNYALIEKGELRRVC